MTSAAPTWKPKTVAAQMAGALEPVTGGVVPPVHVATTFIRDPDNQYRSGFSYGRPDNATVRQTEAVIAALEGGDEALLFGSGMAAATTVVLALDPGAHIVAPREIYWGFRNWLNGAARFGYRVDLVDMSDLDAGARRDHVRHAPGLDRDARPTRCGASPTSRRWPRSRTRRAPGSPSIRPPPRRCSRSRWRSAPTSSCIRRRSISTATPTS